MSQFKLKGVYPALITPFTSDGSAIDYDSLEKLLKFQYEAGVDGVVACGSTGEAATLSESEYKEVIAFCRTFTKDRIACIAGVASSDTQKAASQLKMVEAIGVDAALVLTPPYNKPPQKGLVEHYRALKKSTTVPLIAYNVPGRTGINLLPKTVQILAQEGSIIGIKESSGNIDQVADLMCAVKGVIPVLTGECSQVLVTYALGGAGTISASANVAPDRFVALRDAVNKDNWEEARKIQLSLIPLVRTMFMETNPIPVKCALALKGIITCGNPRLPLIPAEEATIKRLKEIL